MGVGTDSRRPPLPAPTESMDETSGVETELATDVTSRTDKTSYSIPEDGSPITISTQKINASRDDPSSGHYREKSQTSLLIEYFEASKGGDKARSKPSVRVKVTPSASKRSKSGGHDAIQITGMGKDRKPSYTRRISLGGSSKNVETGHSEATEVSHSSESNLSGRPPVDIEVLNATASDMSYGKSSRGLLYAANESNVSSMPPDSLLEEDGNAHSGPSRGIEHEEAVAATARDHLTAPIRTRSRSTSRERITQRVMEKLGQTSSQPRKSGRSSRERSLGRDYEPDEKPIKEHRRRTPRTYHDDDETVSGADSSQLSSRPADSQVSYRSDRSQPSRMTNNPKLLEMVEDTIKRMILPEINAIKEDQKTDRKIRSFDERRRSSLPRDGYEDSDLSRRVSKSSSSPNITSKPKVVLNRDGNDPGTTLSRGDSERNKVRRSSRENYTEHRSSSRRSPGKHSRHGDGYDDDEDHIRRRSSKGSHGLRDAAAAGIAGGVLTAAALKHHDSQSDVRERRKKHSKSHGSRSRSTSVTETGERAYTRKEDIPPMPLASHINDSDITRDSIVSTATERPTGHGGEDVRTAIREVSRGSVGDVMSPTSRTPTRTPTSRGLGGLGMSHTNHSIESPSSGGISSRARTAALAAAGLGGVAVAENVADHHDRQLDRGIYAGRSPQRNMGSPVQSVSSLKKQFEDDEPLVPPGVRPKSTASRSSAGRLNGKPTSQTSLHSAGSSPTTKLARSRVQSQNMSGDEYTTPIEHPETSFTRDVSGTPGAPHGETVDDWYEEQHLLNNRYRDSMGETTTNRDSYQTNPFPEDDKRFTMLSEDSVELGGRPIGAVPEYVHTPASVKSAVASLMEPSNVSLLSNVVSPSAADEIPAGTNRTYADRMAAHLHDMGKENAAIYEGSTLSQTMPSQDRWAAIKGHARTISTASSQNHAGVSASPRQSEARSLREQRSLGEKPVMGASGLPIANDPIPEIGHFDDSASDLTTNPSIIHGPLGGDATGKDTWPYTPEPQPKTLGSSDGGSVRSDDIERDGLLAAAGGGAAALAAAHVARQPTVEEEDKDDPRRLQREVGRGNAIDREATPTSPAAFRDEGYVTDAHARSVGAVTPGEEPNRYSKEDLNEYTRAMDAQSLQEADIYTGGLKHARHISGNSHGMDSPLYDSATGKGVENIQSKDIVALMDHLTVRDAQRNARDTEILVTLVRSAAEMRQSFDEMRRFITEQDRLIMHNTDRSAEQTVQKALSGPRPQPLGSPRTPKRESQDEIQAKRKNVLRRALKGLTGGKREEDLARVEKMLMHILDNVEDLKHQGVSGQTTMTYTNDSLDSYEKLRAAPDSGYEPEGRAGTSSTASHSGQFSITPRAEKQQFHSGYDGRRGSEHRVSTVVEGDEDELEPHEAHILQNQFENNERLLTPTQELQRQRGLSSTYTPPRHAATFTDQQAHDLTPKTAEKQRKHRSNGSSAHGNPKVSRWSKTTASSAAPDAAALESPIMARGARPISEASRSGSELDKYDDEEYELRADDRLRSTQSLAREQARALSQSDARSVRSRASRVTRTPSPLIPSEVSAMERDDYGEDHGVSPIQREYEPEFDDPKYQAHRNSLLLQHPQPRPGTTGRHQNTLESQAQTYDDVSGTNSDLSQRTVSDTDALMFGSAGTAALAKNRFSQAEPLSPISLASPIGYGTTKIGREEDPLVPQSSRPYAPAAKALEPEPEPEWEPQYSNSGFSRGGYYSSPYGSGHLLEPIEEVRYSLETDSGHISPEPQQMSANMRSSARKITGPRPMGSKSPQPASAKLLETSDDAAGTVRRKPVARSQATAG